MSVLSFLGDIVGGVLGLNAQSQANESNMELAKYAFDRNYQMWQENNAYNAPSAQMQRLQEAGLNPNLVYGSGSVVGNTSGSTPQYNAPHINPVSSGGFVSDAVKDGLLLGQQVKQIKANTTYTETQADVAKAQMAKLSAETAESLQRTARSKFDLGLAQTLRQNSIDVANANLDSVRTNTQLNQVRMAVAKLDLELKPLQGKLTESQISKLKAETSRVLWDLNLEQSGRIPQNGSVLNWLINQVIRVKNGDPSVLSKSGVTVDELFKIFKSMDFLK